MKFFRYDGSFVGALERLFNLALLNIIWLCLCVPIITIGASTTALYTVTLKMADNEEGYILKPFLTAFKENLKRGSAIWLIFLGLFFWCYIMITVSLKSGSSFLKIIAIFEVSILIILIMSMLYVFSILATYENSIINTIKNSFLLATNYLPHTLGMMFVCVLPIIVTGFVESMFPVMIFFWIFFGGSTIALFNSYIINDVFKRNNKKLI